VVRKLQQVDSIRELPKDKKPPDRLLWDGSSDELNDWLDRVFDNKRSNEIDLELDNIEG
jgi:hypothetical protein